MSVAGTVARPPAFRPEERRRELARVLRRRRRLRAGIVQLLAAAAAVMLAFATPHMSAGFQIPTGRAIEMLIAVGAGTVTFIGVVFSLLFLVVQFGSTTFTPRLTLFRDAPIVWRSFALYTAVVVYSFTAALVIGGDERTSGTVPIAAFVGVVASLVVYRRLQMGAFKSIQLASTLAQVRDRGREVIDGLYTMDAPVVERAARLDAPVVQPAGRGKSSPAPNHTGPTVELRWNHRAGIVQVIDVPRVLRAAERADAMVVFRVGFGEMLAEEGAVAVCSRPGDAQLSREVLRSLTIGDERTFEQDPALAPRVLADIALRALSPGVNDPTTAVQALDATDALLRALVRRDLDIGHVAGSDGVSRVALVLPSWDDYLSVALDEILALPALSPHVRRRIARLLDELAAIAPPQRLAEIELRRTRLDDDAGRGRAEQRA